MIVLKYIRLAVLIVLISISSSHAQPSNPLKQTIAEDDWSLPTWVQRSPNSGLYDVPAVPDALSLLIRWKDLNPTENVYDWRILDAAVATGKPFFIRIWASDVNHCPDWVKMKHPNTPVLHYGEPGEQYFDLFYPIKPSSSDFYAIWDPNFNAEFKKFLSAFKAKNYLANPNVKFMYASAAWRWNEWELGPMLAQIKLKAPITPENFVIWFKEHLDDFAEASNGHPHKMVFTGYGKIENPIYYGGDTKWFLALNDLTQGNNILTSYAVSIGMGVREGAQEYFNNSSDSFAWGAPSETINNISYQTIDDNHPLHKDPLRIIGTENEGFCDSTMLQGGVCSYYHLKMSTLKAMQLRVNWLNTRDNLVAKAPALYEYARKTMNKSVKDSPDAWAVLRQSHDPLFSNAPSKLPEPKLNSPLWTSRVTLPFRNWEKWLKQREVLPDGKVVPIYQLKSDTTFDYYNFKASEALRTDRSKGSNYMYFAVDDSFIKDKKTAVEIKITYFDNFKGNWWLEYDANAGEIYKKSSQITNSNDNKWKTVTLKIDDAGFNNRQNDKMDFRIYNGGKNDLSVRFVRVIKTNDPALQK
jgi:hypothetical protein